ncbi:MAG: hypothetical protein ABSE76_03755, partial [Minisyncoccia bacterium]|jgi:hypothetical protein
VSLTNNINSLAPTNNVALTISSPTVSNPSITGGSIANTSISGLTAAEIPSLNYFPATTTIALAYGGTGTSTPPAPNELLLSDANGNWEYVATSSLGISGGGGGGTFTAIGPNGQTQTGPSDSMGNCGGSYSQAVQSPTINGALNSAIFYCVTTTDLPAGSTFTVTTANGQYMISAMAVIGANGGLDKTASTNITTNSTSASLTTGTLATANEIVVGAVTCSCGWGATTNATNFSIIGNGGYYPWGQYQVVNSTTPVVFNPSWTTTGNSYSVVLASFKTSPILGGIGAQNFQIVRNGNTLINITGANVNSSETYYYNSNPMTYYGYGP